MGWSKHSLSDGAKYDEPSESTEVSYVVLVEPERHFISNKVATERKENTESSQDPHHNLDWSDLNNSNVTQYKL